MNSITKFVIASAIAASSTTVLFTATAFAQDEAAPALHVETADLNLYSSAGQDRLSGRINRAVREVCEADATKLSLQAQLSVNACMTKARRQAIAQVRTRDGKPLAIKFAD